MGSYDVFISFRNTDDRGCPTRDAEMAEFLYHALRAKGYNPFFSKYSIDSNGRADYITLINNALETAKVLVAVATSRANITSRWVKREINMFSALMMREPEGSRTLVTYRSDDFPVNELPVNLADLQSFPDEKAIVRFIDVALREGDGFRNDGFSTEVLYAHDAPYNKPAHSSDQGIQIGDVLDNRYSIINMIGLGGMSKVFLAMDKRTNRQVAVKEIRKSGIADFSVVRKSIQYELELLRLMHHPALPELIDVLTLDDSLTYVMEYIPGESLQKVLSERGAQSEDFVVNIAQQLAELLDYMHNLPTPIIYRDMKPANIMLKPDGKIKLIDFGTARQYKPNKNADTICLGTVGYAAPEQFGGMGQTDARTDIYGLGVTLYHLVTGKSPAEPPYEVLPIRQVDPNLSKGLESLIQTCTRKNPDLRYQSAKELLTALNKIKKRRKSSIFRRKPKTKPAPKKKVPSKKSVGYVPQFQQPYAIPGAPAVQPKFTPPAVPVKPPVPPPVKPPVVPIPAPMPQLPIKPPVASPPPPPVKFPITPPIPVKPPVQPGFVAPVGNGSGNMPKVSSPVTVILGEDTNCNPPIQPPKPVPDLGTTASPAEEKTIQDFTPKQDDLLLKFSTLDPESQQIVRQLIDKLSK